MSYYCPFVDKNGNFLSFNEIEFSHLEQLTNIDEGYKVEYKSVWDSAFKKKTLPKSMSSFANTDGGWLFVGINNDGTINPLSVERTDFAQQIGEILKSHTSPYPKFETKFLTLPSDDSKGVLIIYVYEGIEPPYICNGTVYTRVGSSSEPVRISKNADIDYLYSKRNQYKKELDEFCVNKILDGCNFSYCTIYLYNPHQNNYEILNLDNEEKFMETFAKENKFETWMPSTYFSYIFSGSKAIGLNNYTTMLELFRTWEMKLHFPLCFLPNNLAKIASKKVGDRHYNIDLEGFNAIDAYCTHRNMTETLKKCLKILADKKININDYEIRVKFNNIKNAYMFFATQNNNWIDFIGKYNFRYSPKEEITLNIPFSYKENEDITILSELITYSAISYSFGYTMQEFGKLLQDNGEIINNMFGIGGSFCTTDYYEKLEKCIDNYI